MKSQITKPTKLILVFTGLIAFLSTEPAFSQRTFVKRMSGNSQASYVHIPTKEGGYAALSSFVFIGTGALITKADVLGTRIWEIGLDFYDEFNISAMTETTDGGFVFIGNNYNDGIVGKVTAEGVLMWTKSFTSPTGAKLSFNAVAATENNAFIVAGHTLKDSGGVWNLLVRFDSSGRITSSQIFEHPEVYGFSHDIVITSDGGHFIFATNASGAFVFRLNHRSQIQWAQLYSIPSVVFRSMALTSDDGAILIGNDSLTTELTLLKLDKNGRILLKKRILVAPQVRYPNITADSDGGYLITDTSSGMIMVKTDPNGKVRFARTVTFWGSRSLAIVPNGESGYFEFGVLPNNYYVHKVDADGVVPGCTSYDSMQVSQKPFGNALRITAPQIWRSSLHLSEKDLQGTSAPFKRDISKICP